MLWKKESTERNAFYVDLFPEGLNYWEGMLQRINQTVQSTASKKSDTIALQMRQKGNAAFRARNFIDALELYGDSLRFAEPKSEHISLAYANRASCFLKLQLYEKCLKDIEFAEAAGYPEHLMPKLDERKMICLENMNDSSKAERMPSINEPNDQFPFLASVAEMRKNVSGEYSVVAKSDIDVGQVILIGEPIQKYLKKRFGLACNICCKEYGNLVPCKKCSDALFCPECQDDALHVNECGVNFVGHEEYNIRLKSIVRFLLQTLKVFPDVDELMEFVEQCRQNPTAWSANLVDERAQHQLLFGREINEDLVNSSLEQRVGHYSTYKALHRIPEINEMFGSKKHQRFLMHLIADCVCRITCKNDWSSCTTAMPYYFKQSCHPNIYIARHGSKLIYVSLKSIKRGEPLCISRVNINIESKKERQMALVDLGYANCQCARCEGKLASPGQRRQIYDDPLYRTMKVNTTIYYYDIDKNKRNDVPMPMDECVELLRKYGRFDWCDEISNVLHIFQDLYALQLYKELEHPFSRALFQHMIYI